MDSLQLVSPSVESIYIQRIAVSIISIHYIFAFVFVCHQNVCGKSEFNDKRKNKLHHRLSLSVVIMVLSNVINWVYCHIIIYDMSHMNCHLIIAISSGTICMVEFATFYYTLTRVEVIFATCPGLQYAAKFMLTSKLVIFTVIVGCAALLSSDISTYSYSSGIFMFIPIFLICYALYVTL